MRPTTTKYKSYSTHYFESHPICVVTSFGLREIFENRSAT
jgi:hypothetical protein